MEKRKRDQVIKQKEEEAQKKKSDLEIELLKRQQKLEQVRVIGGKGGGFFIEIIDIKYCLRENIFIWYICITIVMVVLAHTSVV